MNTNKIKFEVMHGDADKAAKWLSQYGEILRDDRWESYSGFHREVDVLLANKNYSYEMVNGTVTSISY